ncbi:hypothetical protein K1719_013709 [Acacia pycnantha]|nr:hypothetical protein K1719_013709 [Acacia pycnantha]
MSLPLSSTLAKKILLAAMVIMLLFSSDTGIGVRGQEPPQCPGTCEAFPNCDDYCKQHGYPSGQCVPPQYFFCCCSKPQ